MLEKPAGDNLDEYRRLIDLAQRKHLHVQMIYLFRYMSAVQEMLQRVRKGRAGPRLRVPGPAAQGPRRLPALRGGAEAVQGRHVLRDGRARHRHDGRRARARRKQVTPFLAHHHTEPPANYIDNGVAVFGFEQRLGHHRGAGAGGGPALAAHRSLRHRGRLRHPAPGQRPPGQQEHPADRGLSQRASRTGRRSSCRPRRCRSPTCASSPPWSPARRRPTSAWSTTWPCRRRCCGRVRCRRTFVKSGLKLFP